MLFNIDKDPSLVLGDEISLSILRYLYNSKRGETGRKIAIAAGYSPQAVLNSLKRLEKFALVLSTAVGRANLYELNRRHWFITKGLVPLWDVMNSWKSILGNHYAENLLVKPLSIIIFGSYARGDAKGTSDMDILFVFDDKDKPKNSDEVLAIGSEVYQMFGVHPSEKVISISEFKKEVKKGEGLMRNVFRQGVSVYGLTPSEVLSHDRKKS